MNIKNKTFLVTGAGSGIGRELALILLERGAKVAAVDIREENLLETKKLATTNSENIFTFVVDIANKEAVNALPEKIIAKCSNIDGVINNAGIIQPFVKVVDLDYEAIEKVMNVNFYGTLYMTKAFLPLLLKRPEGYIVNVSSMGGFLPVPGQSVYGASKAAVKLLTEGLYAELKNTNVHVTVVFPGATNTNISVNSGIQSEKSKDNSQKSDFPTLPAKTAAEIIVSSIEKNKPMVFAGKDSKMMNFLYRLNPVFATNLIAKQMRSLLK
jgi:short-subunit dehydrogenase